MANFIVNPVTGIAVPTPGIDPGEEYAILISNALNKLSELTHTGVANLDGYQIPSDGININKDLSAQSHNIVALRSTRYTNQGNVLSGSGDVDCVYFKSGDLWINDGSGTPIQITSGSSVNAPSTNNYPSLSISVNHTVNSTDTDVLFACDSSANTINLTLPIANTVPVGRFYFVKDSVGASETFAITVLPQGIDTIDNLTQWIIADNYAAIGVVSDGVSNWHLFLYDRKIYQNETIKINGGILALDQNSLLDNSGITAVDGILAINYTSTATATYNVPATAGGKSILLCDTSINAITVNLPATSVMQIGMIFIVKDLGNALVNNITVVAHVGDNIEGFNLPKSIISNYGTLTLMNQSSPSNWVIL